MVDARIFLRILRSLLLCVVAWSCAGPALAGAAVPEAAPAWGPLAALYSQPVAEPSGPVEAADHDEATEPQAATCSHHGHGADEAEPTDRDEFCALPNAGWRRPTVVFATASMAGPQHAPSPSLRPPCARA